MNKTEYLGLNKPEPEDFYNVKDMNDNSDILDAEYQKIKDVVTTIEDTAVFMVDSEDEPADLPDGCDCEMPFKLGIDDNGNYGYYKVGETTLTPFGSGGGGVSYQALSNEMDIISCTIVEEE